MPFNLNQLLAEGKPHVEFNVPQSAFDKWHPVRAEKSDASNVINIYDVIGYDYWTGEGVTAKSISEQLEGMGDVVVNINSPGGNVFEGLAIYNILSQHPGEVTVNVVGIAASAASVIAMAGDKRYIGKAAFFMIHNCWGGVCGNRLDLISFAEQLEKFDKAMAGIYEDTTGLPQTDIIAMMDGETWIDASTAVEQGFATGISKTKATAAQANANAAIKMLDTLLARNGVPRSQRRELYNQIKHGTQNATENHDTPNAVTSAELEELRATVNTFKSLIEGK